MTTQASQTYTLYGSYASYYTGKVRPYLRKKGIPFVERLPADPAFRERVRPASGSHRIPQLLTPDGTVVQDSIEIVDYLEARFPGLPAFPETPLQRTFVHLMELLASEGLVRLAWLHRWLFEENRRFVIMDFGRSFRPQGSDEELIKYGSLIADRMMSYGLPEATEERKQALDGQYRALLALLEAHFRGHPYFFGGHPSAADYAIMGALHAHLGRDPAGLRTMQDHAPRTFRWVEHMLTPEVVSPEFFATPVAYPADDAVPDTALELLRFIAEAFGGPFVLDVLAFNRAAERGSIRSGEPISEAKDQPSLPPESVTWRDNSVDHRANAHAVWVAQRARSYFQAQPVDVRARIESALASPTLSDLLNAPLNHPIERRNNRLLLA